MATHKRKADPVVNDSKRPKSDKSIMSFFGAAPKPAGASTAAAAAAAPSSAAKFDKKSWVKGLTDEQRKLLQLEIDTMDESWLAHLKDDIVRKDFLELKQFLARETAAGKTWYPPAEDVYSWSRHTPFHNVKVVIVGQDPYHNDNQAHGLAFSVRPPTPAPPSLRNMYIALKKDYPSFVAPPNRGGLLTPWADQGVLMLNNCLTVRAHDPYSHSSRGWEKFTQRVIDLIVQKRTRGVVFMAWGSPASKRVQKIDKQRHLILQSVHPSPFSAARGFFDCGHFRKANEWLIGRYGSEGEIDWALAPGTSTKSAASTKVGAAGPSTVSTTQGLCTPPSNTSSPVEPGAVELDPDSEDEAALEEALHLAEAEAAEAEAEAEPEAKAKAERKCL